METLTWFLAYLCFPYNYLKIALRWRKSSKKGGGLYLRVRHFEALAKMLNQHEISYVLLRGFPTRERLRSKTTQEDFDVLASALSIQKIVMLGALVPGKVSVDIYFDIRPSVKTYHYYPPILAQQILAACITHPDGYAVPNTLHHFLSLAYHVVYHKGLNADLPQPLEETIFKSKHYETFKELGNHPDVKFDGTYTLLSLHEFLKKFQFNMPFDLLKKWPGQHPLLTLIYGMERKKIEAMSPQCFPLVFAIRSDAGHQGHDSILEISNLISGTLEISQIVRLSEDQIRDLSVCSRGGNWVERQRKKYYHVQPTHIIICYFGSRDRIDHFCENELPEFKKMIRDKVNQKYPHPNKKQRYVIHGADDLWESLDCLRIVGLLKPRRPESHSSPP